jgi:PAS domain S-box-containing protein
LRIRRRKGIAQAHQVAELYSALVERSPHGLIVHDRLRILYVNPATVRMFGYADMAEMLRLTSLVDLIAPEDRELALKQWEHIRQATDTRAARQLRGSRKDGSRFSTIVLRGDIEWEGAPATLLVLLDYPADDATHAAPLPQERLLQAVFDTIPLHVFVKDRESRYAMANAAFTDFLGLPLKQCLGKTLAEISGWPPEHVHDAHGQDQLAFRSASLVEFTDHSRTNSRGEPRWLRGVKLPLRDERGEIVGLLGVGEDVTERRRTREQLDQSIELMRIVLDTIPQTVFLKDLEGRLLMANASFGRMWNMPVESVIGKLAHHFSALEEIPADERTKILQTDQRASSGEVVEYEIERHVPIGKRLMRVVKVPVRDTSGAVTKLLSVVEDITEKRKAEERREELEAQLQQIQKLELIGQLAAGVAHDFNNLLTPILGHAEVMLATRKPGDSDHAALEVILQASRRAADLTRHLLAFGQKQVLNYEILAFGKEIAAMLPMVERVLGATIEIRSRNESTQGRVRADGSQLHQVLMNLVVNARDAMGSGGILTVETADTVLDRKYVERRAGVKPGPYVVLSVSDTGSGMTQETLSRVFEPFFTTKGAGRGTGLGLSIVYGIVQQHGGHVEIESELGVGTTLRVYLPQVIESAPGPLGDKAPRNIPRGTETILVVDDQESVRNLMAQILTKQGYLVVQAGTAESALDLAKALDPQPGLLVSDMNLPRINGVELYRRLSAAYPRLKALFVSGMPGHLSPEWSPAGAELTFLPKPFSIADFATKVRAVLDG